MLVTLNYDNYVDSYAVLGNLTNGIEVSLPSNLSHFYDHYQAYKMVDGALVFDPDEDEFLSEKKLVEELRERRKTECFSYIDRSKFWYDSLTPAQLAELSAFYEAWLEVTDTLEAPEKPSWLE